ncbi:internal virion protein D [Caudoviricetes sp.]|nr:internal virion protein D [Caudoviricetes sp.]
MGGKTSTTTQQVQIPPEVLARYNAVNTRAEGVAAKPFQSYSTDPADFVAQLNQQQQTGIQNVNAAAGAYQPYMADATGATKAGMASVDPGQLDVAQYMNPFQQQVIDTTMDRMRQEQEQQQSGALGTAISSGAFGGDRAGIAAANLAQQQGMATGSTLAGLNAQNFSQALQTAQQQQGVNLGADQANLARLMAGGQQLAGLGQAAQAMGLQGAEAQINAGTLGQQTEQAGKTALYNQFQQQQAYPFQVAQFLANIAMGTGALSGSTTQTTQPTSFWSDRRLKHDIKKIGATDEGLPIYKFKYKGDDSEQTHIGFMADEVEEHRPEAVGVAGNGYKYVDYDRATKADGGGVAGPYGAMVGSQPGAGSYVPQAYLPVGELMIADGAGLENAQKSLAQQLEAAAGFGENMVDLKKNFGKGGDFWDIFKKDEEPHWRGGVAGYATGGPAYLEDHPGQSPVGKETYLSDTINSQEEGKRNQIMQPGSPPPQGESTIGKIADIAKIATMFLSTGGVAGRHGYATDGTVEEEERRRLTAGEVPKAQTLGSLPDATVRPAMSDDALVGLAGAAIDRAESGLAPETSRLPVTGRPAAGSDLRATASGFARMHNVPEDLFLKLVGQESSFNPEAVSDRGALGLSQLMPATAKELGVDPNDPEQNLEGGARYLRQLYDQFGSWDRALAAYNGGQGNLRSAIDRATAIGGSYLDYMPEETQNYVKELSGVGVTGGRGSMSDGTGVSGEAPAPSDGLAGGLRLTHDKPYNERTTVGKMFYNPDGTVNKDALLSIASGIGTMASSPSRYLLSSILQGVGGAANTYAGLESQRGEITAKNIENADMFQKAYLRAVEYGYAGTPEDYAQSIKYTGPISLTGGLIGVQGGNGSAMEFMGAPLDPFGRGMNKMISVAGPDGQPTQVMAGQTLGYLKALETKLSRDVEMGIASPEMLEQVRSAIAGHTGQITTANGDTIADPTSRDVRFGAAGQASDADTSIQLTKELPAISQGAYEARRNTNELADALSQMPTTGNLSPWISTFGNVATQLGVVDSSDAATGYEKAIKVISSDIENSMSQLGGSVDTSVLANAVRNARPGPNMTPGAIEELLAVRAGIADYQIARSEALNRARRDPNANLAQVDREFAYEHPIEEYVDVRRPQYEGTIGTDEIPEGGEIPEGSTDVDTNGRPIIYRGGRWVLQ